MGSGLKESLNNLLAIDVEYWDPFKAFTFSDSVDKAGIQQKSSQFNVAVGLALRG